MNCKSYVINRVIVIFCMFFCCIFAFIDHKNCRFSGYLVSPNTSKVINSSSFNEESVQSHATGVKLVSVVGGIT